MGALFYAIQNNMNIIAIPLLAPPFFILLTNLKVFSAAVFGRLLMDRKCTGQQWFAMLLLATACCCARLDMLMRLRTAPSDGGVKKFLVGVALTLGSVGISGFAGVCTEVLLKKSNPTIGFWTKNSYTYTWGFLFTAISYVVPVAKDAEYDGSVILNKVKSDLEAFLPRPEGAEEQPFFYCWPIQKIPVVWGVILANVVLGLTTSLIFRHLSSTAKTFAQPVMTFLIALGPYLVFGESTVAAPFLIALVVYLVSCVLYAVPIGSYVTTSSQKKSDKKKKVQ